MIDEWSAEIAGIIAAAVTGWMFKMFLWMRELVYMHRDPDKHGFGDGHMATSTDLLRDLIQEHKAQTHYLKWLAKKLSQEDPPPPMGGKS